MAAPTTNIEFAKTGLSGRIAAFFASIAKGMETYAHHLSRMDQVEALNAKTDAELAALGVSRDEIPRYVFRDLFYV